MPTGRPTRTNSNRTTQSSRTTSRRRSSALNRASKKIGGSRGARTPSSQNKRMSAQASNRRSSTKKAVAAKRSRSKKLDTKNINRNPKQVTNSQQRSRSKKPSIEAKKVGRFNVSGLGMKERVGVSAMSRGALIALWSVIIFAVCLGVFFVLYFSPILSVKNVLAGGSKHLSANDMIKLADVPKDSTLLNLNDKKIQENVSKNPWVKNVYIEKDYPNTIKITVEEYSVEALVNINSSDIVWYLSEVGTWLEPTKIAVNPEVADDTLVKEALAKAKEEGKILIRNVPTSVIPKAGTKSEDSSIKIALSYMDNFTQNMLSQIIAFDITSENSVSCLLSSGLTIALGDDSDIESKEQVIDELMKKYPNQLTYINVRTVAKPTYRKVDNSSVDAGSGVE